MEECFFTQQLMRPNRTSYSLLKIANHQIRELYIQLYTMYALKIIFNKEGAIR